MFARKNSLILWLLFIFVVLGLFSAGTRASPGPPPAKPADFFDMSLEELMEMEVTTGASRPMARGKMPASVTVITADEIKLLGLRDLTDVINYIVPGGVADIHRGDKSGLYYFRGIGAEDNYKFIFMIDGLNCNSMTAKGAFTEAYLGLLDDLDRIEITQGVSSTLYGDGASSGVINFITKTGKDFQGTEVTAGIGSNDKYETSVKYGKKISDTENDFYYAGFKRSDGFTPGGGGGVSTVKNFRSEHAASGRHWDHFTPSGKFHANIQRGDFTLRMRYVREEFEEPYKTDLTLYGSDTESGDRYVGHQYMFIQPEIKHKFNENHSIKANVSFTIDDRWESKIEDWYGKANQQNRILRAGEEILAYGERKIRSQFFHYYDGWANHKFTSGAELFWMLIGPDFSGDNKKVACSSAGVKTHKTSKTEEKLYFGAVFLEDIWQVTPRDTVFAGVRVENHSLTPTNISPRAAITHDLSDNTNVKFLYSTGYRIPAWTDYTQNEAAGYTKPKPEKIQSFEAHLMHKFTPKLMTTLIGYYTIYEDLLYPYSVSMAGTSKSVKYNFPEVRARGLEFLADYQLDRLKLRLSHSFSQPVHFSANNYAITQLSYNKHDWAVFPTHMTKAQAVIKLIEDKCALGITYFRPWAIRGQQNIDSKLKHPADYINATLTFNLNKNLELQLSGYNLTGEDRPFWGANTLNGNSRDIDPHRSWFVRLIARF